MRNNLQKKKNKSNESDGSMELSSCFDENRQTAKINNVLLSHWVLGYISYCYFVGRNSFVRSSFKLVCVWRQTAHFSFFSLECDTISCSFVCCWIFLLKKQISHHSSANEVYLSSFSSTLLLLHSFCYRSSVVILWNKKKCFLCCFDGCSVVVLSIRFECNKISNRKNKCRLHLNSVFRWLFSFVYC